jgi:hypothetical protein
MQAQQFWTYSGLIICAALRPGLLTQTDTSLDLPPFFLRQLL